MTISNFQINFAPINVAKNSKIIIGRQPYSPERLSELRAEFFATHVFKRDYRENVIIDIPLDVNQETIGNIQEEIDLSFHTYYLPDLLRASLVKHFAGNRDILSAYPVSVLGANSRGYLHHPNLPEWIQARTLLRLDTRTHYIDNKRVVGMVIESRVKNLILNNCEELIAAGISPLNRYVQKAEEQIDCRIMCRKKLVGRVVAIEGNELVLEDHIDEFERIESSSAFLEARRENITHCVQSLLGSEAQRFLSKAEESIALANTGPQRKAQLENTLGYLREKVEIEMAQGVKLDIEPFIETKNSLFPKIETIPKPILVFDPSATRKDRWNERGLKAHGPYDQRTFSPKKLRIAVICQAKYEGQVDSFIAKFLDGMPNATIGKNKDARYGDGFLRRFQLDKPNVTFFTTSSSSADDYLSASHEALEQASDSGFNWDIALVQVEEDFKAISDSNNPYFATKSVFLKRDVPVQSVRLETMSQNDSNLMFSMNNMSVATYAKLGGIPWLLESGQTTAHELVIGLGSHTVSGSRVGGKQRFVGITTVFSSDGSYLLSDRTAVVPYEGYAEALYDTLKRSIMTVRKQDNWRNTDKVRLVFHMFKPPKDIEADAIKKTVEDLNLENVTFAFLHIAPSHPYLIFDNNQKGVGFGNYKKGVLGPTRGLHAKLSDRQSLVVFSGASELKQATDGMPRPSLLKLHHHSTFTDMTYLARQAFEFSGHSWRMLSPEPFPITIRYSDLISERLSGLEAIDGWDPEAVRFGQIGRTLWFL